MQIQLFTIPVFDSSSAMEEMNKFLRGHRVLEVQQEFVSTERGAYWCFSIRYIKGGNIISKTTARKEKIDYKEVLGEKEFEIFSALRIFRKEISDKEAIPAYAVFTNAELAKIVSLPELSVDKLLSIKGIGTSKAKKYGQRILEMYQAKQDEKSGQSNP